MRLIIIISFILLCCENLFADPLLWPWTHHNQEEYETGVTEESYSGKYSAFIKSRELEKITRGSLWQATKPQQNWLGERIRMTAFLKTTGVKESSGLYLKVYTYSGWIDMDYMTERYVRGDSIWKQYEIVLDIVHDANLISFGAWIVGRGEVLIDGFKFEIVDHNVETTGMPIKREFGKPINLDFEGYLKRK